MSNRPDRTIQVAKQMKKVRIKEMIFPGPADKVEVCVLLTMEISLGERLSTFTGHGLQFSNPADHFVCLLPANQPEWLKFETYKR